MTHRILSVSFIFLLLMAGSCHSQNTPKETMRDRQPAVAGKFYPGTADALKKQLASHFAEAVPSKHIPGIAALIAPHAGYDYSGDVAASAFNQLDPAARYDNVFVIGSSHHVSFEGASVYCDGNFITPLGTVKVNMELGRELCRRRGVFSNRTDAHTDEHSLEVQLPFLQYRFGEKLRIVPIVLGTQTPEICRKIADVLKPYFTSKNLFVISTDFSHYPAYEDAVAVDKAMREAILSNTSESFIDAIVQTGRKKIPNLATSACGWTSVLTLLDMAEGNPDISTTFIQYKNSGDASIGRKDQVVGYNAIVFSRKEQASFQLTDAEKKSLLAFARRTVESTVATGRPSAIKEAELTAALKTNCGAFVTLNKSGRLRGCIGRFDATEPLYKVVQSMAIAAATQDTRFTPVEESELASLHVEISVLTPMRRINSIDEFEPGRHGIYIKKGGYGGTFLPQVAKETGWTKEEFLGHCAQDKAGIGWDGWKDAELFVYEALVFGE
jgi:MEMO1 family protein